MRELLEIDFLSFHYKSDIKSVGFFFLSFLFFFNLGNF